MLGRVFSRFRRLARRPEVRGNRLFPFRTKPQALSRVRNVTTGPGQIVGAGLVFNTVATAVAAGMGYYGYTVWDQAEDSSKPTNKGFKFEASKEEVPSDAASDPELDCLGLEEALRAEEASYQGVPSIAAVKRYDVTRLPSNQPVEDKFTHASFQIPWTELDKSWTAWGVFDGHLGWESSENLEYNLIPHVQETLQRLCGNIPLSERSTIESQTAVANAIKEAFLATDREILELAREAVLATKKPLLDAIPAVMQAYAGSCAIFSLFDSTTRFLHVACVGDSRAVLGRRSESGKYTAIALSEDQTGRNASEVARLQVDHPNEPNMVKDGRLLGLAVSRAFGDFQWKFDAATQHAIKDRLWRFSLRPDLSTPPYLTAEPVVTTTEIPKDSDDFLIMASDGFWDCVSNEQAVDLVQRWVDWKRRGTKIPIGPRESEVVKVRDHPPGYHFLEENVVVQDENAATHLVRNALGGADKEQLYALLDFKAPHARYMRDDITVQVIFFGDID